MSLFLATGRSQSEVLGGGLRPFPSLLPSVEPGFTKKRLCGIGSIPSTGGPYTAAIVRGTGLSLAPFLSFLCSLQEIPQKHG